MGWRLPPRGAHRWSPEISIGNGDEFRDRAGLGALRIHGLRCSCTTVVSAAAVLSHTIMDVLGHSEIGVGAPAPIC
jgi:hypothetical protein